MKLYILRIFIFTLMLETVSGGGLDKVIAHRGASYDAPENTAASIDLAISRGAKIIEFDVRETADKQLYLFHDDSLKRLCGKEVKFSEVSSEELADLDVGSWFARGDYSTEKPLPYREAVERCVTGGAIPLIEHKTGSAEAYAKVIIDLDVVSKVIVQSFNWKFIADIKKLLPDLKVGALGSKVMSEKRAALLALGADLVGWNYKYIEASDVTWLKENKFEIATYTVNHPTLAQHLIDLGVDYIITDRPKHIANSLK